MTDKLYKERIRVEKCRVAGVPKFAVNEIVVRKGDTVKVIGRENQ